MPLEPISDQQRNSLLAKGRRMPRTRHQHGRVEPVGKFEKKWKGNYYVYLWENGKERRAHRAVILGLRSMLTKGQAEAALREIIARETAPKAVSPEATEIEITLKWFWENRFRPLREPTWKESCRRELCANVDRYVMAQLGDRSLHSLDKYSCQMHVNTLAEKYGHSVVEKGRVWLKAILEEAVEQDFIAKNPARKLVMPVTRPTSKRTLSIQEVASVVSCMDPKLQLFPLCCVVLGLRPGEALALRWNDVGPSTLRIDEGVRYGKLYKPKTQTGDSTVYLPGWMADQFSELRATAGEVADDAFVFPNSAGGAWRLDNFRDRVLKETLAKLNAKRKEAGQAELAGITFQAMRRTTGTMLNTLGNIKDVQTHLRHAQASTTLGIYVQAIPQSVRDAVERLGAKFKPAAPASTNEAGGHASE